MCLDLTNGSFNSKTFLGTDVNVGQITLTRVAPNGGSPGSLTVAHSAFAAPLFLTGDFRHALLGGNQMLALLEVEDGVGPTARRLFIVDFTSVAASPGLLEIHLQPPVESAVSLPFLAASPGNERLVFVGSPTANLNEVQRLGIFRADNGTLVLPGPLTVSGVNGALTAEVTATQLIITHPNDFFTNTTTAPRPAGLCGVTDPPSFGEAVLGASNPSLAVVTRTATIRNDGTDCLTITAIADDAPYVVQAVSQALPAVLEPGETLDVTIRFAPGGTGNFSRSLVITCTPATGAFSINCSGSARMAIASITATPSSLNFGTVRVGTAAPPRTFTINNTGELDLTVTTSAPPAGDFNWVPIVGPGFALTAGANSAAQTVNYSPSAVGPSTPTSITITPSQGAARTVSLSGVGCVAEARISVPGAPPSAYGQIERGFRSVRVMDVTNIGNATLTFTARVAGANAANFGLVLAGADITDAPGVRNYSVLSSTTCPPGGGGANIVPVAVSFFADGPNGSYVAELIIEGHNATNFPVGQTWTFPLMAEIIDPVPIDVALVLDTSGSMSDQVGTRTKLQAANTGSALLVQMLRDVAPDRCAIVSYGTTPVTQQPISLVSGNQAALLSALGGLSASGATNIAGGAILGAEQLETAHPDSPPSLKKVMVVLTDGKENRCFQEDGAGPFYSITGLDMPAPGGSTQSTSPWTPPANTKVYAIGLGAATDINANALVSLATATGAGYQGADDLTGKSFFLLEKYYTQIFMETAGLAQITDPFFTLPSGQKHEHLFDTFPGDVNCMVVIYDHPDGRLPFHIESSSGELFSGTSLPPGYGLRFRSTPTARFAEIMFPKGEPGRYAGQWRVIVEHTGVLCAGDPGKSPGPGFTPKKCREVKGNVDYGIAIGAGSNLRLQPWVDPNSTYVGESFRLNATLAEAGLPVTGATVKVLVTAPDGQQWTVALEDDGLHEDGGEDDGDYGGRFDQTYLAGNYQLTFVADGMQGPYPFHREAQRTKPVLVKSTTPDEPGSGGSNGRGDECCTALVRWLRYLLIVAILILVVMIWMVLR